MLLEEGLRLLDDVRLRQSKFDGGVVGLGVEDVSFRDAHAVRDRRDDGVALRADVMRN